MHSEHKDAKNALKTQFLELLEGITHPSNLPANPEILLEPFKPGIMKLSDSISRHADWVAKHIYHKQLNCEDKRSEKEKKSEMFRLHHGAMHVDRAAGYIPAIVNFHRRYDDEDYRAFTDDDVKLMQIAMIFHDGARKGEGRDEWDNDSSLLCYFYLTQTLFVPHEKAKLIAEAIANKDNNPKPYFNYYQELMLNEQGKMEWKIKKGFVKNPYIEPIRQADMFDVRRARPYFKGRKTDFYQKFINKKSPRYHPHALKEFSEFRMNVQSIIERQGDGYQHQDLAVKKRYEHANSPYAAVTDDFKHYPFLAAMYADGKLITDEMQLKKPINVNRPTGWVRGVSAPTMMHKDELAIETELRKIGRLPGIPTRKNRTNKFGSRLRSIARVAHGSTLFCDTGFWWPDEDLDVEEMREVAVVDFGSGHGKKRNLLEKKTTVSETVAVLEKLDETLAEGGAASNHSYACTSTEAIYNIKLKKTPTGEYRFPFRKILASGDPNVYNFYAYDSSVPFHRHAPVLKAIAVQKYFEHLTRQKLPIAYYSGLRGIFEDCKEFSPEKITQMWTEMCWDYMSNELAAKPWLDFTDVDVETIKVKSMYKKTKYHLPMPGELKAADVFYDKKLRQAVNEAINQQKKKLREQKMDEAKRKIPEFKKSIITEDEGFWMIINYPELLRNQVIADKVLRDVKQFEIDANLYMFSSFVAGFKGKSKEFFADKKACLNSEEKNEFYLPIEMRYFSLLKLLKQFKPSPEVDLLLKIFKEKIVELFKKKIKENTPATDIKDLMNYIIAYEIDSPDLRREIAKFALAQLRQLRQECEHSELPIGQFSQLAKAMAMYHLIDESAKELLVPVAQKLANDLVAGSLEMIQYGERYVRYTYLADAIGIPFEEQKSILLKLLQRRDYETFHKLVSELYKFRPAALLDKDVFQAIVCHEYEAKTVPDTIVYWVNQLSFLNSTLKSYMPTRDYTDDQRVVVEKQKEKIHAKLKDLLAKYPADLSKPFYIDKIRYASFFIAAKIVDLPLEAQQQTMGLILKNGHDRSSRVGFLHSMNLVASADPLTFTKKELFAQLMEACLDYPKINPGKDNFEYFVLQNLSALEENMPGEQFTNDQLDCIQKVVVDGLQKLKEEAKARKASTAECPPSSQPSPPPQPALPTQTSAEPPPPPQPSLFGKAPLPKASSKPLEKNKPRPQR